MVQAITLAKIKRQIKCIWRYRFMRLKQISDCCKCGCPMSVPEELHLAALNSERITFYCAYGHGQHYNLEAWKKKPPSPPNPETPKDDNIIPFNNAS